MENKTESRENPVWDIAKLVMAFFVTGIHTGIGTDSKDVNFYFEEWIARLAVPLFFCIAGYFLFLRIPEEKAISRESGKKILRYCGRILRMYLLWTLIYLIPQVNIWIKFKAGIKDLLVWLEYVFIRGDSYLHLWYLSSLCVGTFLVWLFGRKLGLKKSFIIASVLYAFGLLWLPHFYLVKNTVESSQILSAGLELLNKVLGWPRNGIFFGFVFVCLGALLSRKKTYRNKFFYLAFAVIFTIVSFGEVALIYHMNGKREIYCALQLSLLPAVYFWFCFLHEIKMKSGKTDFKVLRNCSTFIYCIHPMVIFICTILPEKIGNLLIAFPFEYLVIIYAISFAISYFAAYEQKKGKLRFLKYLH